MLRAEPVEVRARLPAEVQQVLEPRGRHERRPRAAAARAARSSPSSSRARTARLPARRPRAAAASTDSSWRSAVGTFAVRTAPPSSRTASVNVPPTSTPRIATLRTLHRHGDPRLPLRLRRADRRHRDRRATRLAGLYREHGYELPLDRWPTLVGTIGAQFDPMGHLEELVGRPLAQASLHERRHAHELTLVEAEEFRPGIADYLAETKRRDCVRQSSPARRGAGSTCTCAASSARTAGTRS